MDIIVKKICWKDRLAGLKAIDVNAEIARGESCPNDDVELWVENTTAKKFGEDAADQCRNCPLCGLNPTSRDFEYVDDRDSEQKITT